MFNLIQDTITQREDTPQGFIPRLQRSRRWFAEFTGYDMIMTAHEVHENQKRENLRLKRQKLEKNRQFPYGNLN